MPFHTRGLLVWRNCAAWLYSLTPRVRPHLHMYQGTHSVPALPGRIQHRHARWGGAFEPSAVTVRPLPMLTAHSGGC